MPTDQDGSSSSTGFGFSILSRRRDQVHSMESAQESLGIDGELEALQKNVCDRFRDLAAAGPSELLSISWLRKLLEAFVRCQDEFRAIIRSSKDLLNKPPMEKYISDYFDRSVKALDVCNAIRDGIEQINQWHKLLEIVLYALDNQRSIGEGHFRRAKKALDDLAIGMLDEKDSNASLHAHRNRSFGRSNSPREQRALYQFRSLSWSVSRTWSAAKHLQAISSNLTAPRTNEILSSNGLSLAVFTMNNVLLFVMWVLVALIPCQDRGLQIHFNVTRQFLWAVPILSLHERILEESRKRDRKNTCGLLKEIHDIEKTCRNLNELADSVHFPLTEEKGAEVKLRLKEVKSICKALANDLDPFQRQVREVFHQLVRSRSEGLDLVARAKGYES